ncbi:MAG: hypothetical protein E6X17_13905, partial [Sporomusaceae bacterium]|nr:hypothetical protein [Sporomusaceae bacterium]
EKRLGCVKKARCLSAASLGPLAGQSLFKAFAGRGLDFLGSFLINAKRNKRILLWLQAAIAPQQAALLLLSNLAKSSNPLDRTLLCCDPACWPA